MDELASPQSNITLTSQPESRSLWRRIIKYVVDPRRIFHRYFLLVLICLFIPGPYYSDGLLAAYKGQVSSAMHLSNKEFSMLFALPSLTGIACGPAGIVVTHLGRTCTALMAGFVCALSALVMTLGFHWGHLTVMLVSRLTFWLALYVLLLVQTLLIYGIFEGEELAVAYSLIVTACRLGAILSYSLSGPLLAQYGLLGSLSLSTVLVFLGFLATVLFAYLFRGTSTAQQMRPLMGNTRVNAKPFSLRTVRELPRCLVPLFCAIGALYGIVFPFEVVADDMLQKRFGFSADGAGYLLSVIPLVALGSPFYAPIVGSTPRRKITVSFVSMGLMTAAQAMLNSQAAWVPFVAFPCMGFGYAGAVCALWTALPVLVRTTVAADNRKTVEGLATGLSYMFLAISQFISNVLVGVIKDRYSYESVCAFFVVCGMLGMLSVAAISALYVPVVVETDNGPPAAHEMGDAQVIVHQPSSTSVDGFFN